MPYQINRIMFLLIVSIGVCGCRKNDAPSPDVYIDPTTQPSALSHALKVENGSNHKGNAPMATTSTNLLITEYQETALVTADNFLFIPLVGRTSETVSGVYFQVIGADNYWVVNTTLAADRSQVLSLEIPANVLKGKFKIQYGLKGVNGSIGKPVELKAEVIGRIEYCSNSQTPEKIQGNDGLVSYSFTLGDKAGWVVVDYNTYSVPDRIDLRYNKTWIASTGSLLTQNKPPTKMCSAVTQGDGFVGRRDSFVFFYDGAVSKKLDIYVSGCLDGGTQWDFQIRSCPTSWYSELPGCPCNYSDLQGMGVTSNPAGRWEACGPARQDYHYGAVSEARWLPAISGWPGQQCTYDANGKLITGGIAAGSPDKVSPRICDPWTAIQNGTLGDMNISGHWLNDIRPWNTIPCRQYLAQWPANNKRNCPAKLVSGISHMPMIGDMTCEEVTRFIKGAKESNTIDPELKRYILGELPYVPGQLKDKMIAWRTSIACSSFLPSDLCKHIDEAIGNL